MVSHSGVRRPQSLARSAAAAAGHAEVDDYRQLLPSARQRAPSEPAARGTIRVRRPRSTSKRWADGGQFGDWVSPGGPRAATPLIPHSHLRYLYLLSSICPRSVPWQSRSTSMLSRKLSRSTRVDNTRLNNLCMLSLLSLKFACNRTEHEREDTP